MKMTKKIEKIILKKIKKKMIPKLPNQNQNQNLKFNMNMLQVLIVLIQMIKIYHKNLIVKEMKFLSIKFTNKRNKKEDYFNQMNKYIKYGINMTYHMMKKQKTI